MALHVNRWALGALLFVGLTTAAIPAGRVKTVRRDTAALQPSPTLFWKQITAVGQQNAAPRLDGDFAYIQTGPNVLAFTQQQGYIVRVYNSTAPPNGEGFSRPSVHDGVVYFGAENNAFFAYDAVSGDRIWEYGLTAAVQTSSLYLDGTLYFGDNAGIFHAIDAKSGNLIWNVTCSAGSQILWQEPVLWENTVIFGAGTNLCGVDRKSGAITLNVILNGYMQSTPAVDRGVAYVGDNGQHLTAVNISTGNLLWSFSLTNTPILSSPAISADGKVVYFQDTVGTMTALDSTTGNWIWSSNYFATAYGGLTVIGDVVVAPTQIGLYALSAATGDLAWSYIVDQSVRGVAYNSSTALLYFGTGVGTVYALQIGASKH